MPFVLMTLSFVVVLIGLTELLFRAGRHKRARAHAQATEYDAMREQVTTVQVATLGLLALMLGFTIAIAESRFNQRRLIHIDEANAVGTTYMRAGLLPEPARTESRALLRKYVDTRIEYFYASSADVAAVTARGHALVAQLWARAEAAATEHPMWEVVAIYIESLNNMIDLEATRHVAYTTPLPGEIHALLLVIALAAIGITGYATGLSGARNAFALYVVPLLVALAYAVVVDLDRTRFGLIAASDQPMERMKIMLDEHEPTSAAR